MDTNDSSKGATETQNKSARDASAAVKEMAAAHARVVMSDIWYAMRTDRQVQLMMALLVVSLVCWNLPFISLLFYPFKLVVSFIGQACAILIGRLTGGTVMALIIDPDGGVSALQGGNPFLIINASALGTSLLGGFLIWWGRSPRGARMALRSIGTAMLVLTLFYADAGLKLMIMLSLTSLAVLYASAKASEKVCHILLLVIAVQCTMAGLLKMLALLVSSATADSGTDAYTMQSLTNVPAIIWSVLWGLISVAVLILSFWISYRPPKEVRDQLHTSVASTAVPPAASAQVGAADQSDGATISSASSDAEKVPAPATPSKEPADGAPLQPPETDSESTGLSR